MIQKAIYEMGRPNVQVTLGFTRSNVNPQPLRPSVNFLSRLEVFNQTAARKQRKPGQHAAQTKVARLDTIAFLLGAYPNQGKGAQENIGLGIQHPCVPQKTNALLVSKNRYIRPWIVGTTCSL